MKIITSIFFYVLIFISFMSFFTIFLISSTVIKGYSIIDLNYASRYVVTVV